MKVRKVALASIFGLSIAPGSAGALGLGEIELSSALNQPLHASIDLLSVRKGETDGMIVTLASQEAFLRADIDRPYLLNELRFEVQQKKDGTPFIKVFSRKPIVEPFLNFLIEVDWPRGRLLREYTLLLDPPSFMTQEVAAGESQLPAASRDAQPTSSVIESQAPAPVARTVNSKPVVATSNRSSSPTSPATVQTYGRVKANETLWPIANKLRRTNESTHQMMMALLRYNPDAFVNQNINLLKKGVVLRVPDHQTVVSMTRDEAIAAVGEQNALWQQLRRTAQSAKPVTATEPLVSANNDGAQPGASVAKLADDGRLALLTADAEALSSAAAGEAGAESAQAADAKQLGFVKEELAAERLNNEDLQAQVGSLGKIIEKMERLITVRDAQLAELQAQIKELQDKADKSATPVAPMSAVTDTRANTDSSQPEDDSMAPAADAVDVAPDVAEAPVVAELGGDMEQTAPAVDGPVESVQPTDALMASSPEQANSESVPDATVAATPAPAEVASQTVAVDTSAAGFSLNDLLNKPALLGGASGGLAALLGLLWFGLRRRKGAGEDDDAIAVLAEQLDLEASTDEDAAISGEADDDAFANTEIMEAADEDLGDVEIQMDDADGELVATGEDLTPESVADEDAPKDDVLAEADVYLAYGLLTQAEELLKDALDNEPYNQEYHAKLLETYYAMKNAEAFTTRAETFSNLLDGMTTPLWDRVIAMGADLCPGNELFRGGDKVGISVEEIQSATPQSTDLEIGATNGAEDFSFGMDEDPLASESDEGIDFEQELDSLGSNDGAETDEFFAAELMEEAKPTAESDSIEGAVTGEFPATHVLESSQMDETGEFPVTQVLDINDQEVTGEFPATQVLEASDVDDTDAEELAALFDGADDDQEVNADSNDAGDALDLDAEAVVDDNTLEFDPHGLDDFDLPQGESADQAEESESDFSDLDELEKLLNTGAYESNEYPTEELPLTGDVSADDPAEDRVIDGDMAEFGVTFETGDTQEIQVDPTLELSSLDQPPESSDDDRVDLGATQELPVGQIEALTREADTVDLAATQELSVDQIEASMREADAVDLGATQELPVDQIEAMTGGSDLSDLDLGSSDEFDTSADAHLVSQVLPALTDDMLGDDAELRLDDDADELGDLSFLETDQSEDVAGGEVDGQDAVPELVSMVMPSISDEQLQQALDDQPIVDGLSLDEDKDFGDATEVETMLDLAKAYIDMGDADSASSALEEIIASGSEEQKREAETLKAQLN